MVETLAPLKYGTVVGRYLAVVGDTSSDPDKLPDAVPLSGTITFTPMVNRLLVPNALPVPATVMPMKVDCILDSAGYLSYGGERKVVLLATDDPDTNPMDFVWKVTFDLKHGTQIVTVDPFYLEVPTFDFIATSPPDEPVDLTLATPVEFVNGVQTTQGAPGKGVPSGGLTGQILMKLSDAAHDTAWVPAPTGGGGGATTMDGITDATVVGKSVVRAANAAAARTAIGAGTSSLAIGTIAGTAADAGAVAQALINEATNRANAIDAETAAIMQALATVAETGDYGDLSGKPTIPQSAADVGADPAGAAATVKQELLALIDSASGVIPEDFGVTTTNTYAQNSANWPAVVNAAHTAGLPILIASGKAYRGRIDAANKNLRLTGGGTILTTATPGATVSAVHTQGASIAVSSVSEITIGPVTGKTSPPTTNTNAQVIVPQSSLNQFKANDIWRITSADKYEWSGTNSYWKASMFPVAGIAFTVTPSGAGIKEGDTITGLTSGASGVVGSYAPDAGGTTGKVILKSLTGTFVAESIQVSAVTIGTINPAGAVVRKGSLQDTHTTTITIRKVPDYAFIIDEGITFKPDGDIEAYVGTANRESAVMVLGARNPIIRGTIAGSWSAAVSVGSCWRPIVDINVKHLVNMATTGGSSSNMPSEQGYGYGIEILGSTEHGRYTINGDGLRHAFTTNCTTYGAYPSGSDASMLLIGTSKNNIVSGVSIDPWTAGWDTHLGAYNTTFLDAHTFYSVGAYRYFSMSTGFQNRSFNTNYIGCTDKGSVYGFIDLSGNDIITFQSVTRHVNCFADDHQYAGFANDQASESKWHRRVYIGCRTRGDGRTLNSPYGSVGFLLGNVDADVYECSAERFSLAPMQLSGATSTYAPTTVVRNFTADYRESPTTSASGIRTSGTSLQTLVLIGGYYVYQRPDALAMPSGAVRHISGNGTTIKFGCIPIIVNTATALTRLVIDSGTPTVIDLATAIGGGGGTVDMTNIVQLAPSFVANKNYVVGEWFRGGSTLFYTTAPFTSATTPVAADAVPATPGAAITAWASPDAVGTTLARRDSAGGIKFTYVEIADAATDPNDAVNKATMDAAIAAASEVTVPYVSARVVWVQSLNAGAGAWTYGGLLAANIITARPGGLRPGDGIIFIGLGTPPAWAADYDEWTEGG